MEHRRTRQIRPRPSAVVTILLGCAAIVAGPTTAATPALGQDAPTAPDAPAPRTTTRADVPAARDPETLFREGFEDGLGDEPVLLDDYVGHGGARYTADPYWLDTAQCNGIVTGAGVADVAGCPDNGDVRRLAEGLGTVTAEGRHRNHAVSAFTKYAPPPGQRVQLRTVTPVPLPAASRFLSFGVSTAATACGKAAPLLAFSLLDGDGAHPTSPRPIDACAPDATRVVDVDGVGVRVGTHVSPGGLLVDADEVGVLLENEQASGSGNDAAFDDLTVLDSTPTLAWSFADGEHVVGDPVRATVSVVNTSEAGQKQGWSFRTALPDGTRPADGAVPTAGCAVDRIALDGGDLVVEGGGLADGDAACEVELDLVPDVAGAHTVGADELVSARGVLAPAAATLVVVPERPHLDARAVLDVGGDAERPVAGDPVTLGVDVVADGSVAVHDLAARLADTGGVALDCPVDELAPGARTRCSLDGTLQQAELDAGVVVRDVVVGGRSPRGTVLEVPLHVEAALPVTPALAASVAVGDPGDRPRAGDRLPVAVRVEDVGTTSLHGIAVVAERPELDLDCPLGDLVPDGGVTCTGEIVLGQDDLERGAVETVATVSGLDPRGVPVEATASSSLDLPAHPGLGLVVTVEVEHDGAPVDPTDPVQPGDALTTTWTVRNDGDLVVADLEVDADLGPVACPTTLLLPGQATDCTLGGPHVVTDAEAAAGSITFASQAFGQVARAGTPEATAERVLVPGAGQVDRPVRIHSLLLETTVRTRRHVVSVLPAPVQEPRVLAFTGASLGLVLALGLGLTGAGAALRARRRGATPGAAPGGEASE